MIKAVIFDYFGVISSDEYWRYVKADRQAAGVYRDYTDEVNNGTLGWETFVRKIADATDTTVEEVHAMYATEKINPVVVGYIHTLHDSYKTGLISNAHHEFIDPLLRDKRLNGIFDTVVVSSRLGIVKPDPRIFRYALDQLGVAPEETIYIDDLHRHVDAAKALGMHAVQYQDFEQMKAAVGKILADTDQ